MAKKKGKTGGPLTIGTRPSGMKSGGKGYPKVRGKAGKGKGKMAGC